MSSHNKDSDSGATGSIFNPRITKLAGLTKPEEKSLLDLGISTEEDLSFVNFEDFPHSINVGKRRKLSLIGTYLSVGGRSLKDSTSMNVIKKSFSKEKLISLGTNQTASSSVPQVKNKSQPQKIGTNPLPKFTGDIWDYEQWKRGVIATLYQTAHYVKFLTSPPDPTIGEEVDMNQ